MHRTIPLLLIALLSVQAVAAEATPPAATVEAIDLTRDGSYTSGIWNYRLRFFNAGTRSQATVGSLLRNGVEVSAPAGPGTLATPWGPMVYAGKRGDLESGGKPWGDFGWRPAPPPVAEGKKGESVAPEIDPKGHIKENSPAETK